MGLMRQITISDNMCRDVVRAGAACRERGRTTGTNDSGAAAEGHADRRQVCNSNRMAHRRLHLNYSLLNHTGSLQHLDRLHRISSGAARRWVASAPPTSFSLLRVCRWFASPLMLRFLHSADCAWHARHCRKRTMWQASPTLCDRH